MVQPQLVKIGGPWTRSMIRGSMDPVHERGSMDPVHILMDPVHGPGPRRGSMDPVHERGSMDPVHILMDPVHGPGPRRGSMDQGSMFCTFP